MAPGKLAAALGKGLIAGAVGTAVMTVAQRIEMRLSDRDASDVPLRAVERIFGLEIAHRQTRLKLSGAIHWLYGTAWGGARGVLGELGLGAGAGTAAHLAVVWGAALVLLPTLDIGDPVNEQSPRELTTDLGFHAVYALAAGVTYELLERSDD